MVRQTFTFYAVCRKVASLIIGLPNGYGVGLNLNGAEYATHLSMMGFLKP